MTPRESGRLGQIKSYITNQANKGKRISLYNENPKLCEECNRGITYQKRSNKFCGSSCAATYNNTRKKTKPKPTCNYCDATISRGKKYCNTKCQKELQYCTRIQEYQSGKVAKLGKPTVKRFLKERDGDKCSVCDITDWCGEVIVFELEHIDGNSRNNKEDNLCLICPNCHSQTPTFKGRNRGNGRHSRRVRYSEGKSY